MRSKEKMCANDRIICHEDHCAYASATPPDGALWILPRLLARHSVLDPDTVFTEARADVVCPFEVEIELASRADVFVGDYNYVFEPVTALAAFAPEELRDCVLVIDEAHNLPDRARQIYSPEIHENDVTAIENLAALSPGSVWKDLGGALARLRQILAAQLDLSESASVAEGHFSEDDYDDSWSRGTKPWSPISSGRESSALSRKRTPSSRSADRALRAGAPLRFRKAGFRA
jgi:hypothetical protein